MDLDNTQKMGFGSTFIIYVFIHIFILTVYNYNVKKKKKRNTFKYYIDIIY